MSFVATTTITVFRGEGVDAYGDEIDLDVSVYTEIPASILEQRTRPSRPVEGRTDNVRGYTCRVRPPVVLRKDDRIKDERTLSIYTVDEIVTPVNPAGHAATRAVLRRVT